MASLDELKRALLETQAREAALRKLLAHHAAGDHPCWLPTMCADETRAALATKPDDGALRELMNRLLNKATGIREDFRCQEAEALIDAVLKGGA